MVLAAIVGSLVAMCVAVGISQDYGIPILIIGTSLWVFFDAKKLGVRKGLIKGVANLGIGTWQVVSLFLWIIAFPMYLIKRPELKLAIGGN